MNKSSTKFRDIGPVQCMDPGHVHLMWEKVSRTYLPVREADRARTGRGVHPKWWRWLDQSIAVDTETGEVLTGLDCQMTPEQWAEFRRGGAKTASAPDAPRDPASKVLKIARPDCLCAGFYHPDAHWLCELAR